MISGKSYKFGNASSLSANTLPWINLFYHHMLFACLSPLIVLCGENAIIISVVPAGDDVRDGQRPDGDEQDASHNLDDAAEADGEQGEEGGDDEPPARAVNHDALTNNGIALS